MLPDLPSRNEQSEEHSRVANALGFTPHDVASVMRHFDDSRESITVKACIQDRIQQMINLALQKLRTIAPSELSKIQGEILGLEHAMSAIDKKNL